MMWALAEMNWIDWVIVAVVMLVGGGLLIVTLLRIRRPK
jgi:hypothetical protein